MVAKSSSTKKGTRKKEQQQLKCNKYTSTPIVIDTTILPSQFTRADLEFHGVDHSGASYQARAFINNPTADENTEPTPENGYVGSFHIFGHGGCFGDVGHCEVNAAARPYDPRPSHPLQPIKKVLIATESIRNALKQSNEISITVVPMLSSWTEKCADLENVLKFERINLVTYN